MAWLSVRWLTGFCSRPQRLVLGSTIIMWTSSLVQFCSARTFLVPVARGFFNIVLNSRVLNNSTFLVKVRSIFPYILLCCRSVQRSLLKLSRSKLQIEIMAFAQPVISHCKRLKVYSSISPRLTGVYTSLPPLLVKKEFFPVPNWYLLFYLSTGRHCYCLQHRGRRCL